MSWYGDRYVNYTRLGDGKDLGSANIDPNAAPEEIQWLCRRNPSGYLAGFWRLGTYDRVDVMLRRADGISLRKDREAINGVECFVIAATSGSDEYTVWIDPEHGYSVARVEIHVPEPKERSLPSNPRSVSGTTFVLRNGQFERVGEVWVPMKSQWSSDSVDADGQCSHVTRRAEVKEVILHPDHKTLRSLVPDDISEGADVWIPPAPQIRQNWRGGKPVKRIDEGVVAALDKTLEGMLAKRKGEPDANTVVSPAEPGSTNTAELARHRTHCGLYCLYSALRLNGQKLDYRDLVQPEYYGSHAGSTLAELRRGAMDYGLYAEVVSRLSTRALRDWSSPVILHVKPDTKAREYNHYALFLGTEEGKARVLDPPGPFRLVPFQELAATWDGAGLLVSASPLPVSKILTADRQRLLLCGVLGALVLVVLHMARLVWYSLTGAMSRRRTIGLTLGQTATLGFGALVLGLVYHFTNDEALLANKTATASVQRAYQGAFIPKISKSQVHRRLGTDTVFIDARLGSDYQRDHLDGAVSLPVDANDTLWKERTTSVPRDKPIVVYCQSAGCKFAERVSVRLADDGFTKLSIYRGGWRDWTRGKPAIKARTP